MFSKFRKYFWLLWAVPPGVLLGVWFYSLHCVTMISCSYPRPVNGLYGRCEWDFNSASGFFEIGVINWVPADEGRAQWLRQLHRNDDLSNHHWSIGSEDPEGATWGNFLAGLGRLNCYSTTWQYARIAHQGHWLEVPYWILTLIAAIPLAMSIRRHRLRKHRQGFEITSPQAQKP